MPVLVAGSLRESFSQTSAPLLGEIFRDSWEGNYNAETAALHK